jgi:hypothetical protein
VLLRSRFRSMVLNKLASAFAQLGGNSAPLEKTLDTLNDLIPRQDARDRHVAFTALSACWHRGKASVVHDTWLSALRRAAAAVECSSSIPNKSSSLANSQDRLVFSGAVSTRG